MRRITTVFVTIGILVAGCGSDGPTFGTIPPSVFETGAPVEATEVPDYISYVGMSGDSVIGYVEARYVVPIIGYEDDMASDDPIPVVDRHLDLIGHAVPGHGFVPLGTDIPDVPSINVTTTYGG